MHFLSLYRATRMHSLTISSTLSPPHPTPHPCPLLLNAAGQVIQVNRIPIVETEKLLRKRRFLGCNTFSEVSTESRAPEKNQDHCSLCTTKSPFFQVVTQVFFLLNYLEFTARHVSRLGHV